MTTATSASSDRAGDESEHSTRVAVVGNPNAGKTELFNRLCGLRAKTANFPGTTVGARVGTLEHEGHRVELIDLPGHYGLNLNRPESQFCRDYLNGRLPSVPHPDATLIVVDSTNLSRNLIFASQALQQGLPAVVALNMMDLARRRGMDIDVELLRTRLGCPVVPISARTGEGLHKLLSALRAPTTSNVELPDPTDAQTAAEWADSLSEEVVSVHAGDATHRLTDRLDAMLTHPILGTAFFALIMTGLFSTIFSLSSLPMDLIDLVFAQLGAAIGSILPEGAIHGIVVDGIVPGIAGAVIFLPQICLLFFLISLLEDTGYLARAVFVTDRILGRFGLPGQSFVPLLSAHACAIPAIMSARLVSDPRDRLATILVAPFMSCSARLPVYVLLVGILFVDRPLLAGVAFAGCYVLGALAALFTALIARRTIIRGRSTPMVLELPTYKLPSLRTALLTTYDRATDFLRNAATIIVAICVVLWWLGEYPHVQPPAEAIALRTAAAEVIAVDAAQATRLDEEAEQLEAKHAKSHSFMGRMGHAIQPAFEPLGYDWQVTIGVLSSFIAREVFVSTMAVVLSGEDDAEDEAVLQRIAGATRDDGTPLFTMATAASLLVFYVLAMQCLPTLAVTRRETGSWKWAALQLGYMTAVAYVFALVTYVAVGWTGFS